MLKSSIRCVSSGRNLSREEAAAAMRCMLSGTADSVQVAGLLTALRTKGEAVDELVGMLDAMREQMTVVPFHDSHAVDMCGTGGDGSGSFNLSSAAALVAAAGGVTVAKHGNRAVSSNCGSAEFLEALGLPIYSEPQQVMQSLETRRFAILFAPHFHPAAKHVAPIRKQLGIRTIFNLLGPLANPARVKRQLVGVFSAHWLEPLANVLAQTGSSHVMIVHGEGGLDEISASGATHVAALRDGEFTTFVITPADLGLRETSYDSLKGGDAAANAARFERLTEGKEPALAEWVIANSAPAFYLAGRAPGLYEAAEHARDVIESGMLAAYMSTLRESAK